MGGEQIPQIHKISPKNKNERRAQLFKYVSKYIFYYSIYFVCLYILCIGIFCILYIFCMFVYFVYLYILYMCIFCIFVCFAYFVHSLTCSFIYCLPPQKTWNKTDPWKEQKNSQCLTWQLRPASSSKGRGKASPRLARCAWDWGCGEVTGPWKPGL